MVVLKEEDFGVFKGEKVKKFTWETTSGFSVSVISYGAIIQSILVPDKNGVKKDVVLGFDDFETRLANNRPDILGGVIGRCAGRTKNGTFKVDGVEYQLSKNLGPHHLHGGVNGFDTVNWKSTTDGNKVIFSYLSKDGEEGYPGDLLVNVTYEAKEDGTLSVEYKSMADKKTPVNISNHAYFNLAGQDSGAKGLAEHTVAINADKVLAADVDWVPTGKFINVEGTPLDLRSVKKLGDVISNNEIIRFHHDYCVVTNPEKELNLMARLEHPGSSRFLELYSNQPIVIFYTSHYMAINGRKAVTGKDGAKYEQSCAFCLETVGYEDALNNPNFPSTLLVPGNVYRHVVQYKFGTRSLFHEATSLQVKFVIHSVAG